MPGSSKIEATPSIDETRKAIEGLSPVQIKRIQQKVEATRLINQIRKENGGLTTTQRKRLQQTEPEILEIFDDVRRKLGKATKKLAKEPYAKDTRFVFELIQNAEDNLYTIAEKNSEIPSLEFHLYTDRIVIDSNEDGFTEDNIRAICSIGKSTKVYSNSYIEGKGIGFKSVFKVARKVHIQSGLYSFFFEYQRGDNDDGLGMVIPWPKKHEDLPNGVRTRITLFLLDKWCGGKIFAEFEKLPDTLLLFLTKLRKLTMRFEPDLGSPVKTSYNLSINGSRSKITKTCGLTTSDLHFMTARRAITNMPYDDARKLFRKDNPDETLERDWIKNAEIVLAFPLDKKDLPIMEEQHIYASLPVRKAGFNFLLQSDFITQASREDVIECRWNDKLLEEAAQLFDDTIGDFLNHPTLSHFWIRYLPRGSIADKFWQKLEHMLLSRIQKRNYFYSRALSRLEPAGLCIVPQEFMDEFDAPLLPDFPIGTNKTVYASNLYTETIDAPILRRLGSRNLEMSGFIDRLSYDLEYSVSPRIHSMPPTSAWQVKVASILIRAVNSLYPIFEISSFRIIPLNNKRWVAPKGASIFLPTSDGIEVPTDLKLSLVDTESIKDPTRAKLFAKLGITECEPSRIFPLIKQFYQKTLNLRYPGYFSHLKFLFWHHEQLPQDGVLMQAISSNNTLFWPDLSSVGWVYKPDGQDEYAAYKHLRDAAEGELKSEIMILNPVYGQYLQNIEQRNDKAATSWAYEYFGAKTLIQLYSRTDSNAISPELQYIAEKRPEVLIGTLKANWHQHKNLWSSVVSNYHIPIVHSPTKRPLAETILPVPKLVSIAKGLGLEENFGFIKELEGLTDATAESWYFLEQLGVVKDDGFRFWLAMLKHAKNMRCSRIEVAVKIYGELQRACRSRKDKEELIKSVRELDLILLPRILLTNWVNPSQCVWDGPSWFDRLHRLRPFPEYEGLEDFFHNILQIPNVTADQLLDNIVSIKAKSGHVFATLRRGMVSKLYGELGTYSQSREICDQIRSRFEDERLIYHPINDTWHPPSSCIWAEDCIQLPDTISLATAYKNEYLLFLLILGIKRPALAVHARALQDMAQPNARSKKEILRVILLICAFDPKPSDLESLLTCACFPIRTNEGGVAWYSSRDQFAIVDRKEYNNVFTGRIEILDYTLQEVHQMRSFLIALGLESHFLSGAVKEETQITGVASPDNQLTREMQKKAYAICRYAAHLNSPNATQLSISTVAKLQKLAVYRSDDITKIITIHQRGLPISAPGKAALFHMEDVDGQLKLYIPNKASERYVCKSRALPQGLLNYLGASTHGSSAFLTQIIDAPDLDTVDFLLEDAGIISLLGIYRPQDEAAEGFDTWLDNVIRGAQSLQTLPKKGDTLRVDLSTNHPNIPALASMPSYVEGETDFKLGVAGELFVFELFTKLNLPGFCRENWQSRLRHLVRVHNSYSDMASWSGPETSSIVYDDQESTLTQLLVDKGYLDQWLWDGQCPKYYIEVKATTGALDTPLFLSQNQFDMMEEMMLFDDEAIDTVYLIARVFQLGSSGMGLKLYVDPARLRLKGELCFKAEKYEVTPAEGFSE